MSALPIIPPFEMDGPQRPLGFPMCQNRYAPMVWSYFFEKNHVDRIVEIGSLNGGFTLALAFMTWLDDTQVYSIDVCRAPSEEFEPLANVLGIKFVKSNVFTENVVEHLMVGSGVHLLLCDGGNKTREFNEFAYLLKPGDFIGVHDCGQRPEYWPWSEVTRADIERKANELHLLPVLPESFSYTGWLVFRRPVDL